MILKTAAKTLASLNLSRYNRWYKRSVEIQEGVFRDLLKKGKTTRFGKDHHFADITGYESFKKRVPVRDYEALKPYIEKILKGEKDVLWPGWPQYFSKTSGTTSGAKFIPITSESMPNHIWSARHALLMYILKTGRTDFIKGKMIFISGSPELDHTGTIPTGRLSGIVHHHIPRYLHRKRLPTYQTNCIAEWEEKLATIVRETVGENMSLISGIPPWVEMYFEKILAYTGKPDISSVFPDFNLFVYGGVNFEPYRRKFDMLMGKDIPSLETFPASEGFVGFQDEWPSEGLLLIPDGGIFYEFIPADQFYDENPPRISLEGVETGVNYVMILNTNAGLWGYNIGDTVSFVSTNPYRFVSTGRLSQFTSAFGEHVIAQEAEESLTDAATGTGAMVTEFTLAPLVDNPDGLPCHQWFIEFGKKPADMERFASMLDQALQDRNPYYSDLVKGRILDNACIIPVPKGTFSKYMKSVGKLGGQNKIPHLSNDRKIADWITLNVLNG